MTCQQRIQRAYQIFPGPAERGALGWEEHELFRRTRSFHGALLPSAASLAKPGRGIQSSTES